MARISAWRGRATSIKIQFWWNLLKDNISFCNLKRRGYYEKPDLNDVVVSVFSMYGLYCTDVKASKHFGAGVHPLSISGTQWPQEQIRCGAESPVNSGDTESGTVGGLQRLKLRCNMPMSSPVSHGNLFQHGRTRVSLPVPRNGRPPANK